MWKNYCLLIFRCTAPSLLEKEMEDEVLVAAHPDLTLGPSPKAREVGLLLFDHLR
jgi:hypothetical protein